MPGERTEAPTPRRVREARRRGEVARSPELASLAVLLAGAAGLKLLGPWMAGELGQLVREALTVERAEAYDAAALARSGRGAATSFLRLLGPWLAIVAIAGVGANLVQTGFVLSGTPLRPRLSVLNPVNGARRLFGLDGLVGLAKAIVKLAVVAAVVSLTLVRQVEEIAALGTLPLGAATARSVELVFELAWRGLAAFAVVTAADFLWQRWRYQRSLRMSKQEVREEYKETEGNPEIKAAWRRRRHQLLNRMIAAVPKADVVVTNPVHYAVALKYDPVSMQAPVVVAKGERLLAQRIKEVARRHGVPIVEEPALARALFRAVPVGKPIPASLYRAVAEVLAWVYTLRQRARGFGGSPPPAEGGA